MQEGRIITGQNHEAFEHPGPEQFLSMILPLHDSAFFDRPPADVQEGKTITGQNYETFEQRSPER